MRVLIAVLLSFQFVNAPLASSVGERKEFQIQTHLMEQFSEVEAKSFSMAAATELKVLKAQGAASYVAAAKNLSDADKQLLKQLINKARGEKIPSFSEKNGEWQSSVQGHTISFTLADLYQQQMIIDGSKVEFKDVPVQEWENKILAAIKQTKKVSWLNVVGDQLLIRDAQAEPISGAVLLVIAAVVGAVLAGMAWYNWRYKPKKAVETLNAVSHNLKTRANFCEASDSSSSAYSETFSDAANIGTRTKLNSLTSTENALSLIIKEQISSGERSNLDCYQAAHEAGKQLGIDIPQVSAQQLERMELMGGGTKAISETDTKGALFNVCAEYNRLSSCMERFVKLHVNDVESFKDDAVENYNRYRQRSGAAGQ